MPYLNDKEYQCDLCLETFNLVRDKTWDNEKVEQEYKENFPASSKMDVDRCIVCDNCHQEMLKMMGLPELG